MLDTVSASVAGQLGGAPPTLPQRGLRDAAVRAVVLTDAMAEHAGGLLGLRGGVPIDLYATPAVFEALTNELPVLPVLEHYCGVHWRVVPVAGDQTVAAFRVEGMPTLEFTAIATQAPQPAHAAHRRLATTGDSIALAVHDLTTGQRVFCAPGLARVGAFEFDWMRQADCLLLDSPLDDASFPSAAELLPQLPARHKVLFGERRGWAPARLAELGISLAYDGMEIEL